MAVSMECSVRGCRCDGNVQLTGYSFEPEIAAVLSLNWYCGKHFNQELRKLEKLTGRDLTFLEEECED